MLKLKTNLFYLLVFILLLTGLRQLNAQSFTASVNSTTVGINEPFQVSFQFGGDDINSIRNFKAPDFKGLRVLSGPNQSQSVQIINGAMSASLTFSYYVQTTQLGKVVIGPASLDYKGKTYRTQPINLNSVKGQAPQTGGGSQNNASSNVNISGNVFIRAIADKQRVMKGEQVTVTYKLYTRMDISSPQISKLPTYQGFWSEELETSNRINFTTEVVDGKQYHVGVLKKAALFPTQTGELSVTPFELKIPVVVPKQRRRSGDIFDEFFNDPFFNQGQTVEYNAKSNTIKVTVLPLPSENVPASFTGAVGDYTLHASLDKTTVKANEPVTLKINISGTGNVNLIDLPEVKIPAGFEKYDPKINTIVNRGGGVITGQKTFELLMVPRVQGQNVLPPVEFAFFNHRSKKYVTLNSPEFVLNVEKGDGSSDQNIASGFNKEDVKLLGEDIRFIKTSVDGLSKEGGYTLFSFWFWTIAVLPLIVLGSAVVWKRKNDRLSGNVQLLKYQRAEKIAKNRLKAAKKSLEINNQKDFYSDISLALFGYLEDKLHIPKSEFTIERAIEILRKNNVPPALIDDVKNSVEQCEYARFAPVADGASAMNGMYDKAVKIIVELEKGKVRG